MKYLFSLLTIPFLSFYDGHPHDDNGDAPNEKYMIVGTYTGGKSEGIYVYRFNTTDGSSQEVSHIKSSNPSYLAISSNKKFVYAVNENHDNDNGGQVSAFSFDKKTGELTLLNQQHSMGDDPCYVELDKTGKWAFVANYSSGSFSIFPVRADGRLGEASTTIRYKNEGLGTDKARQEKPHAHCAIVSPDNKWLYVSDLGTDRLMAYSFNASTGKVVAAEPEFLSVNPGSGPRHLTFHPNGRYGYLIAELTGSVNVIKYQQGKLKIVQTNPTTTPGKQGFPGSADIHVSPDGKFLYASNRGDFNDIVVFGINSSNGTLSNIGSISSMGKAPRNFNFDPTGKFLVVGNQDSDEIVVFQRDKKSGLLTDSEQRIGVGKPVCIKWLE